MNNVSAHEQIWRDMALNILHFFCSQYLASEKNGQGCALDIQQKGENNVCHSVYAQLCPTTNHKQNSVKFDMAGCSFYYRN